MVELLIIGIFGGLPIFRWKVTVGESLVKKKLHCSLVIPDYLGVVPGIFRRGLTILMLRHQK